LALGGLVAGLVFILIVTGVIALKAKRSLTMVTSRFLADKANELRKSQLDVSMLLALEAYSKDSNNTDARSSLMRSLAYSPRLRGFLQMPTKPQDLAFSHDGNRLSALSLNGGAESWSVNNLRMLNQHPARNDGEEEVVDYLLCPDGIHWISFPTPKTLVLDSLDPKEPSQTLTISDIESAETQAWDVSSDGRHLAWVNLIEAQVNNQWVYKSELTLWDIVERKQLQRTMVDDPTNDIVFSPDGRTLAMVMPGSIRLLSTDGLKETATLKGTDSMLEDFVFSGDGNVLAAKDDGGNLIVWNLRNRPLAGVYFASRTPNVVSPLASQFTDPAVFALTSTGKSLVIGYEDGVIAFWNVPAKMLEAVVPPSDRGTVPLIIAAHNGDDTVITTSGRAEPDSLLLWSRREPGDATEISGKAGEESVKSEKGRKWTSSELPLGRIGVTGDMELSSNDRTLAVLAYDGTIVVFDLQDEGLGEMVQSPVNTEIVDQAFAAEDSKLLTRNAAHEIGAFDRGTQTWNTFSIVNRTFVADAVFNQGGDKLAVRYQNSTIGLWDIATAKMREAVAATAMGPDTTGRGKIAISSDGSGSKLDKLAFTNDEEIIFWDATRGVVIGRAEQTQVACIAFNAHGDKAISGTLDGKVAVWDVATGKQVVAPISSGASGISNVGFTADGSKLIAVSEDGTLSIWDSGGNALVTRDLNIADFAVSPDDHNLACVTKDGRAVTFYDLEGKDEIGSFAMGGRSNVTSVAYMLKHELLSVAHKDGSILFVPLDMKTWSQRACHIANRNLRPVEVSNYHVFDDQAWKFWRRGDSFQSQVCSVQ
jgi:WD40 repeat protein